MVPDATPERLAELSKAGMRSYMRYWMESFRLPTWSKERVESDVDIKGAHYLLEGVAAGRGVIIALPHLANWDLAGVWVTRALGLPFTTVAERLKPETLYDRFVAYRESLGMEVLPHTGGPPSGRPRGGCGLGRPGLPGRRPRPVGVRHRGHVLRRHGTDRRGPAILAQQTGALLLPVTLWYDDTAVMRGRIHPPVDVPESGTRAERTSVTTQALADAFAMRHRGPPGGLAHAATTVARGPGRTP